jgi:hypothetical protein
MTTHVRNLIVAGSLLAGSTAFAQVTPFSTNADAGWAGWTAAHIGASAGDFISTAVGPAETGSQIATASNNSWGLWANGGATAARIYDFGGTLAVGQIVTIRMDNGWLDTGGTVGFGLQNGSGTNRFEFYFVGGTSGYQINDAGGPELVSPLLTYTNTGVSTLSFTQLGLNTYSFSVNGVPISNTGLTIGSSDISRIRLFSFNAGTGGNYDAYFNNLSVIPEPSTYAALAGVLGLGAALALRRRRS